MKCTRISKEGPTILQGIGRYLKINTKSLFVKYGLTLVAMYLDSSLREVILNSKKIKKLMISTRFLSKIFNSGFIGSAVN
jgi:hypothetical protein